MALNADLSRGGARARTPGWSIAGGAVILVLVLGATYALDQRRRTPDLVLLTEADCADAMDADDSGAIDISDGIALLNHLFSGGVAPDSPFPTCGWDTTGRDGLGCGRSPCGYFPERRR